MEAAERAALVRALGREPTETERAVAAALWSEHCSYKSSRAWLALLPSDGPQVVCGPGENAGAVDIGGGKVAVFKIESHNHPSFIEPVQGAATGVGGILRDVFAMGARPVALLDALRFGSPAHPRTRHLLGGAVAGIGGYGNCVGVPTVGGELGFDPSYDGNPLVNAMAVGVAESGRLFRARASGVGNPVVYAGAKTGRDGIRGAEMASAAFGADAEGRRPAVQVGDPFAGKLLLEACLELMAGDSVAAVQDMGAAGLASASVEMAAKGGVGAALDLDAVPVREGGMTGPEIMLSESQERMLMVLRPGAEDAARAVFDGWGLDFAVIGRLTGDGRLRIAHRGRRIADLPVAALVDGAPRYRRPLAPPAPPPPIPAGAARAAAELHPVAALERLIGSPELCSRRWVWEQYDGAVMGDTVRGPGGDAALVRIHGTGRALALTVDCTPRYCAADPKAGGMQAVAEAWRNLTACGARPLAVTDCLNFGDPERPEVMGQLAGCIEGMAEACRALDFPVVSGNVSLYNETGGKAVQPTPAVGGLGLLERLEARAGIALPGPGLDLVVVGAAAGHLGQSLLLRAAAGADYGPPPPVDLAAERRNGDLARRLIGSGAVRACHDLSDGGLLAAAAEMALAGGVGAEVAAPPGTEPVPWLFGEDQGRYLLAAADSGGVLGAAAAAGVPAAVVGRTGGPALTVRGHGHISVDSLRAAHESWLPRFMAGP